MKKIAILVLLCFAIRMLSSLGAGDAFDGLLRTIGGNSRLIMNIVSFELGTTPEQDGISPDKPGQAGTLKDDGISGIPGESHQTDYPSDYPSDGGAAPVPQSPEEGDEPRITAVTAEEVMVPAPLYTQELQDTQADIQVLNRTSYAIDINSLLSEAPAINLSSDKPQILIIHTHSSEAYSETSASRTLDKDLNVIRVGEVLAEELGRLGFNVIHDTGIYDYPSYSGSYSRSLDAVESYLEENPDIQIVFDLHRDSMTLADGSKYRTEFTVGEFTSAQVMLLAATGEAGLEHPNWKENLKFGLRLQKSMEDSYPGLARPLCISSERYNQHTVPGSILIEIGTDGNTIDEAVNAARLFALTAEPVIKDLIG